ncbi:MAG: bifunctional hydroxymethylpyrimidine kinase/phosphomethylpyrimidine kinase [Devosiaceae bacterium]
MQHTTAHKAVLAISSQVGRGSVGLRAAGFAIERLGTPVWQVPTIWMPWHPGHAKALGVPMRHPTPDALFDDSLQALVTSPVVGEVGAILTGYFASAAQVLATCRAIDTVREISPDVLVVVDPVSADSHGTYVPIDVVEAIGAQLLPRCTIATPNRFEAATFSGRDAVQDNAALADMARGLGVRQVIITSAFGMMKNSIGTLLVDTESATLAEHGLIPGAPHGTGDMLSALLTAHMLAGLSAEKAMARATSSVFEMVARSVRAGSDELLVAAEQDSLARPMAMVQMRQLASKRAKVRPQPTSPA